MKIYVVTKLWGGNTHVLTATSCEEHAKAVAKRFNDGQSLIRVREFEDGVSAENMLRRCWDVQFAEDGSVTVVHEQFSDIFYLYLLGCRVDGHGNMLVGVLADDEASAVQLAAEERERYLAEKRKGR